MDDRRLVRVLKALADERRFQMVRELADLELSCGELGARFDLAQPTMSHHMKILADAGVLKARKEGKHHFVSVDHGLLAELGLDLRLSARPVRRRRAR